MANMEERLEAVVVQAESDGEKWHTIVHGDENTNVSVESGDVPTVAKQLKDIRTAITGGVLDVVAEAENARDAAIAAKNSTGQIKSETNTIKSDVEKLKEDTLNIKNQANLIFNDISSATDTAVSIIQNESTTQVSIIQNNGETQVNAVNSAGNTQVANIKAEGKNQVALTQAQANQAKYYAESCAPAPLGSRLSVPANKKVPDGYEPVWYKNTITRARYPDFFTQLVDTDYLVFVDEATYDNQVESYGMCASYVKVDNDTVILPLLLNYARSGTTDNTGSVLNDQFQGHYHSNQIRTDTYGSGDGAAIMTSSGADEGLQKDGTNMYVLDPKTDGKNGTPRFGSETRPKSYYELVYIKCADISRPLSEEDTSVLRSGLTNKLDVSLNNISVSAFNSKIFQSSKSNTSWYEKNLATGLIKQGGRINVNANSDFAVTFPLAFTTVPIAVLLTPYNQPSSPTSDFNYLAVAVSITAQSFKIRYRDSDSDGARQGYVSWFAVGY